MAGTPNGALIAKLEGAFEVFVTADENLRYQQNLSGRTLAITIIELPANRLPVLRPLFARISAAVESAAPGQYFQLTGR